MREGDRARFQSSVDFCLVPVQRDLGIRRTDEFLDKSWRRFPSQEAAGIAVLMPEALATAGTARDGKACAARAATKQKRETHAPQVVGAEDVGTGQRSSIRRGWSKT